MATNESTLKKLTGDFAEEIPEAGYRLAATGFVKAVMPKAVSSLGEDNRAKSFINEYPQIAESFFGFVLAAVLEILPLQEIDDERNRLAYNLRVRSYEGIGELIVGYLHSKTISELKTLIEKEAQTAILKARGELVEK